MQEQASTIRKSSEVNDPDVDLQDVDDIFNRMASVVLGAGSTPSIKGPSLPSLSGSGLGLTGGHGGAAARPALPEAGAAASVKDDDDCSIVQRAAHWGSFNLQAAPPAGAAKAKAKAKPKGQPKRAAGKPEGEPAPKRSRRNPSSLVSLMPGIEPPAGAGEQMVPILDGEAESSKVSDADAVWVDNARQKFAEVFQVKLESWEGGDDRAAVALKEYLGDKSKALAKLINEAQSVLRGSRGYSWVDGCVMSRSPSQVRSRKRNLSRRSACPELLMTHCAEMEQAYVDGAAFLRLIGASTFSGDEAARLLGSIDPWQH